MKRFLLAIGLSLGIVSLSYLVMNIKYPIFDSWGTLAFSEFLSGNHHTVPYPEDSLLCINVAFDKQLAEAITPEGFTRGTLDVTDRAKLIRLLRIVQQADYRYIFLDIRFPAGLRTDNDEELFSLIRETPRLLISQHRGRLFRIADSTLLNKAALADYGMTAFTGFTRYQYLQMGEESVALRMYRDIDQGDIQRCGLIYKSENRLCRNAQYIRIPRCILEREMSNHLMRYPYLGAHLLSWNTDEELIQMMNGRILLVGDFDHDLHSTYVGDVPGAMLSYLAWNELHNGKHTLSWGFIILLFCIYAVLCWLLLTPHRNWYEYVPFLRRIRGVFWKFFLSLVGWSSVFWMIQVLLYCFSDISLSIAVPTMFFSVIAEFIKFKDKDTI